MQIAYSMDCSPQSYSCSAMPDVMAQALPLRVCGCGMFDCGPGYYTRRSGLNNVLMLYTVEGKGELELEGSVHALTPGTAMVIDCMKFHRYATAPGGRWRFYYVHLQGQMEAFVPILTQQGAMAVEDTAAFTGFFEELIAQVRAAKPTGCFVCNQLLTQLLTTLVLACGGITRDEKLTRHLPALEQCIAYLRKNYAQPITLGDMAAHMHMSQYHFIRVFEAYMRTTPYAYLLSLRINRSHELLMMTDENVQEIARQVGMNDCNAFIRAFKKRFGQTPEAYRRAFRGKDAE